MILKPTVLHFANNFTSQINAAAFNRDRISYILVEFCYCCVGEERCLFVSKGSIFDCLPLLQVVKYRKALYYSLNNNESNL